MKQSKPNAPRPDIRAMSTRIIVSFNDSHRYRAMTTTKSSHTTRRNHGSESSLTRWLQALRRLFAELSSSYHPERHYMRGGGTGGVA